MRSLPGRACSLARLLGSAVAMRNCVIALVWIHILRGCVESIGDRPTGLTDGRASGLSAGTLRIRLLFCAGDESNCRGGAIDPTEKAMSSFSS